ncbi:MAG TPA: PaaI family thioesterase [Acidimicrobiales bacterium]|mgnify:CR=1 FL=1|jgi:acyl-coenzyme A thioesterase PaaI-like protein|nr:PaaI family thioesterase [Acidimicrobiales bacterium]MDP6214827.1 PaaI family thioesterase [Acidimicrobiales bacterium]MDP7209910.1 PaaI family thioesterase [Acidimicrobiales bacterium]HJL89359.1 PaaI family thioesterase [Acidimicrobiales bacterium]HJP00120.1 PaaI family thioesterase [Acidimicrobiales bacterium]|tara:strand:+ start:7125 stop:7814 length:690 start_codon:yes stop_codon:yes gene_type:complete
MSTADQPAANAPDGGDENAARQNLADGVRGLVDDLHLLQSPPEQLEEASRLVAEARSRLGRLERLRWYEASDEDLDDAGRGRLRAEHRQHSLYRGDHNPLAPPMTVVRETDPERRQIVVGEVHTGRSREGPPGRLHGGFLAGLFDDILSGAPGLVDAGPAVTARLEVRYRKATPIDTDLRLEAWVERQSGRRLVARARCLVAGEVTAEAEALFVTVTHRPASSEQGSGR